MITVEIDAASLAKLEEKLSPELYQEAVKAAFIDVTHAAEGEIKARTPVVTGNLRRSIQSDVRDAGRFPDPETRVAALSTLCEYAWWIETGTTRDGSRQMKSKPGGYRMFEEGAKATQARMPEIIAAIEREITTRWGQ